MRQTQWLSSLRVSKLKLRKLESLARGHTPLWPRAESWMQALWLPSPALTRAVGTAVGLSLQTPFLTWGHLHCPGNLGAAATWLAHQAGSSSWPLLTSMAEAWASPSEKQTVSPATFSFLPGFPRREMVGLAKTDKYHRISLKYDTNELIYKIERDSGIENRLTATRGRGGKG